MSIEITFPGGKKVDALIEGFTVHTDQPLDAGGSASACTPFNLFLASLGTCAGIYVKSFCDQRGIPSEGMQITMDYQYDPVMKMIVKFIMLVHVPADFPEQYESAVIKTASLCAVKRHLNEKIENEIIIKRS